MNRYFPRVLLSRQRRLTLISRAAPKQLSESSDTEDSDTEKISNNRRSLAVISEDNTGENTSLVSTGEGQKSLSLVARNVLLIANDREQKWLTRREYLEEWRGLTTEDDVIQVLKNMTDVRVASKFFKWAARQDNYQHTVFTYNAYLSVLVKSGMHVKLQKAYHEMLADDVLPNVYTYGIVLQGLCEAGKTDEACELISDMESKMLTPTSFILNMLVSFLCRQGKIEKAYKYFTTYSEECSADRICYNMLIHGLSKEDQFDRALAVFQQMERENVKPTLVTYNALLYGYCKANRFDEAMDLLKEVSEGVKGEDIVPDSYTYNIVIGGLCKAKKLNTARYVLRRMIKSGIIPNAITYNTLLDGLCLARKVDEANEIFRHMCAKNCDPTVVTYTIMITGNAKVGQLDKAREFFTDMMRRGIEPNVYTYTSLIGGLCDMGKMDEAMEMLNRMSSSGKEPNNVTYTRVISGLCKSGKTEKACELFKESMGRFSKIRPDLFAFNTIIHGLCRNSKFLEAYEYFEQMMGMGIVGDLPLYRSLADGLELIEESIKVENVCEEANRHGIVLKQLKYEDTGKKKKKMTLNERGRLVSKEWRKAKEYLMRTDE